MKGTPVHAYLDPAAHSALLRLQARNRDDNGKHESASSVMRRAVLHLEAVESGDRTYNAHLAALLRSAADRLGG